MLCSSSIAACRTYELVLIGRVFLFLSRPGPYTSIPVNRGKAFFQALIFDDGGIFGNSAGNLVEALLKFSIWSLVEGLLEATDDMVG